MPKLFLRLSALFGAILFPALAFSQTCLHDASEASADRVRRSDALQAIRIINTAERRLPKFLSLRELPEKSAVVMAMRSDGGELGRVVRMIRWSEEELLPGWRVRFVLGERSYSITLTDVRDPCSLTLQSSETGTVVTGYPTPRDPLQFLSQR